MRNRIAKNIVVFVFVLAAIAGAFDKTSWSSGYTIKSVRMNGNNWFGFNVVPKDNSTTGNIVNDNGIWLGVAPTNARYNTIVSMVLTAKSTGRTVAFCACNKGLIPTTTEVYDISSGLDVE